MDRNEQLAHAIDLPARVREVITTAQFSIKELNTDTVLMMLQSVLNKYDDAKFEVACRQADYQQ